MLYVGSSQLHWPLLQDGNRFLRLKQGHTLCLSVFGDLIWGGIRRWQHFNGTHTPAFNAICAQSQNNWSLDWLLAPARSSDRLLQDGNDVLRLKQGHPLYMVAVFRDLIWDGIRIKYHSNSNGTNRHLTSMLCALKAPGCGARFWLLSDPWTPPLGWELYYEVEARPSIVSVSVWRLDIGWGQDLTSDQLYPYTYHPWCVQSKHLAVGMHFGSSHILWPLLQDENRVLIFK